MFLRIEFLLCCIISFASFPTSAFVAISSTTNKQFTHIMSSNSDDIFSSTPCPHPFSELPGDPSLMLVTNVDLGEKKIDIMKKCSKVISKHTGKPEAYIGVSINDNASVLFGGTDDPCALGNMYSIGSIAMESNGKIHADVSKLLEEFNIQSSRMYINYFDMPRANVGWSGRTFAG